MDDHFFVYLACVPVLGIFAQWLAWRTRLPSILLLLLFGMLLGVWYNPDQLIEEALLINVATWWEGEGMATPPLSMDAARDSSNLAAPILFPIVSLSVAIILFEGGLSLRISEIKESGGAILRLVSLAALVTWVLTGLAAWLVLDLHWKTAALLGAILVVTGPTVVIPLLRHIRPNRRVGSIAKWEGIVVDPVGAILAVLVFEQLFIPIVSGDEQPYLTTMISLIKAVAIGVGLALITGWILVTAVKAYLIPDFLHGVTFLAAAMGVYAISNIVQHESGLITVTAMGIYLANQKRVSIDHVIEFKENLGIFLISSLFIILGSRLQLASIYELGWEGVAFLSLMILVIRPTSVWLATIGGKLSWQERVFLGFLAPRGIVSVAVTSVFALRLLTLTTNNESLVVFTEDAEKLVPVVFLVIVGTVSFYGLTASWFARHLNLSDADPQGVLFAGASPIVRDIAAEMNKHGISVALVDTNFRNVSLARQQGLRAHCSSVLAEQIEEEADLSGIGRLLAMTSNDEVNLLATQEYIHLFGRMNTYQLAPKRREGSRASLDKASLRILFGNDCTEESLQRLWGEGYRIKSTQIKPEFTTKDFQDYYEGKALVLMILSSDRRLQIMTDSKLPEKKKEMTLISLVPPIKKTTVDRSQK